jgi:hypothetical protein
VRRQCCTPVWKGVPVVGGQSAQWPPASGSVIGRLAHAREQRGRARRRGLWQIDGQPEVRQDLLDHRPRSLPSVFGMSKVCPATRDLSIVSCALRGVELNLLRLAISQDRAPLT